MNAPIDPAFALLVALAGALLFGVAAWQKSRAPVTFADAIAAYQVLPSALARPIALLLVLVELGIALGLLWPATRSISAASGAGLLVVYAIAMGINLVRGRRDLDCGCAQLPQPIRSWMVIRNGLLAAMLCVLLLPISPRELGAADLAMILGALAVSALLYTSANFLLSRALPRRLPSLESS